MNELILKLAQQADPNYTGKYDDDMGHALVGNEAIQMFAELIVRECIRLCDQVDLVGADECIDNIKEHFEVEE